MQTFPRSVQLRMACFWRMCSYGRRKTSAILNILLFSRLCAATILRQLLTQDKPLILEIEPPEDEITCRRKHFYERNGLCAQPYGHVQLPFQGGGPIVPLVIMSNRNLSAQQCRAFQQYLLNRVVRYTQYRKTLDMADIIDI